MYKLTPRSLPKLPPQRSTHYTPSKPSPLSSSPLRSSPSPLAPRSTNVTLHELKSAGEWYKTRKPTAAQGMTSTSSSPATLEQDENAPCFTLLPSPTSPTRAPARPSSPSGNAPTIDQRYDVRAGRESTFAKRPVKTNPLFTGRSAGDGREARRTLFLKRVKEQRDNRRWEDRGGDEEILRVIWVAEERRRRERVEAEAREVGSPQAGEADPVEEDLEMGLSGLHGNTASAQERQWQESMAEELASFEDAALEALLETNEEYMPNSVPFAARPNAAYDSAPEDATYYQQQEYLTDTAFGSDDDEYDQLFRETMMDVSFDNAFEIGDDQDSMDLT